MRDEADNPDTVLQRVRDMRRELGLSQHEFAKRFGLPFTTYVQWERGRRSPDMAAMTLLHVIVERPYAVHFAVQSFRSRRRALLPLIGADEPQQQAA